MFTMESFEKKLQEKVDEVDELVKAKTVDKIEANRMLESLKLNAILEANMMIVERLDNLIGGLRTLVNLAVKENQK